MWLEEAFSAALRIGDPTMKPKESKILIGTTPKRDPPTPAAVEKAEYANVRPMIVLGVQAGRFYLTQNHHIMTHPPICSGAKSPKATLI
jgi:hypothetical protein